MRGILRIPIRILSLTRHKTMTSSFKLKKLFAPEEITNLVQNFGLKRLSEEEIEYSIQSTFSDYILAALSEMSGEEESHQPLYIEAIFHLEKASKLLNGLPHPAGKMSYRLGTMTDTLNKLLEGRINTGVERAKRFMEKNLARKLRDIWIVNTATPFHAYGDGTGKNPRDFLLQCFVAAGKQYPEIQWFNEVDPKIADQLIKSIKR